MILAETLILCNKLPPVELGYAALSELDWGPVESNLEQRTASGQAEGAMQLLQQMDQMVNKGNVESEGRGLSKFWRRY
ncbi:hypothetical protein QYF61_007746 [Mycteria americana]|uniref:Uncharacterized protein n=1 Tax=Mycteria americana TaxID=33587 RepID=A0AAN7MJJ8_MYCAM|nr:hypothetical protein QYF61_007746 [Mycteria americana]